MKKSEIFTKGIIKENPVFVFLLGMCPTLAVTSTFEASLGMGLLVIFVLTLSNVAISLLKNLIPDEIRIPSYIVIIATLVTIVQMLTEAYAYELSVSLGVFIPLIVVNCIILGRAESFASKNGVIDSALDGLGVGIGFTLALVIIGLIREILSYGSITIGKILPFFPEASVQLLPEELNMTYFSLPAGSFLVLSAILGIIAAYQNYKSKNELNGFGSVVSNMFKKEVKEGE